MDGTHFDHLARSLAEIRSRRALLRGLAGVLAAGALGVRAAGAQDDCPPGHTRTRKGECRCPPGTDACLDGCFDLRRDLANCGECGQSCLGGECRKGECRCPAGTERCGGACLDPASYPSDAENCGECGNACAGGACFDGVCEAPDGAACVVAGDCVSGICFGGVCCNLPCDGECESCAVAGSLGTCTPLIDHTDCVFGDGCAALGACRPGGFCVEGSCFEPTPVVSSGSLNDASPVFPEGCLEGFRYGAHTFAHPGGSLSLTARGADSGGGTLPHPIWYLFTGTGLPSGDPCSVLVTGVDGGGCLRDAYNEISQPAGTYTAIVFEVVDQPGTYTFEVNTFTGYGVCP